MSESIKILNERLLRDYGKSDKGLPNYRIVFSEDEFEKRWVDYTPEGLQLSTPVVELRPKYRQYIHGKYILERFIPILEGMPTDLVGNYTYEPIWVFSDVHGNAVPPIWDAILLILDSVHKAALASIGAKYKDPESKPEEAREIREKRIDYLQQVLFGNETQVGDALAYKSGIIVPRNYGE